MVTVSSSQIIYEHMNALNTKVTCQTLYQLLK
jgi:hypothetical protein